MSKGNEKEFDQAKILILKGEPSVREVFFEGFDLSLKAANRVTLNHLRDDKEIEGKPCVYLLIGPNEDNSGFKVYVGSADDFTTRINQHNKDVEKDFYNQVVVLTSNKGIDSGKSEWLEQKIYDDLKKAEKVIVENKNRPPGCGGLGKGDESTLKAVEERFFLLLSILGFPGWNVKEFLHHPPESKKEYDLTDFIFQCGRVDAESATSSDAKMRI